MPNIPKIGGGSVGLQSGGTFRNPDAAIDPDEWVVSLFRALKNYVRQNSSTVYEIRFDFPGTEDLQDLMPLPKTIIHFEIDDHNELRLGLGDQVVSATYDDFAPGYISEDEVQQHLINFDVGIWASAKSGGVTARLKAFQLLCDIFSGPQNFLEVRDVVGCEIVSFTGGSFIRDIVNDIPLYRVANITLILRVFARRRITPVPYISEIIQEPGIRISDTVIIG